MASININGDSSGSITLSAPTVAGSNTQNLVAASGTLAPIVVGTAQASTSGTAITFTGIPSWVKRITVMFNGVSASGVEPVLVQLGSGSFQVTGYVASGAIVDGGAVGAGNYTTGFGLANGGLASAIWSGQMVITNVSGNIWCSSHTVGRTTTSAGFGGGNVTLGGVLDRVRITTQNSTDTFDAGSINIFYE